MAFRGEYESMDEGGFRRRRPFMAATGIIFVLAAAALACSFHQHRISLVSHRSSLSRLDRDTFEDSDSIYDSALAELNKHPLPAQSLAWASHKHSSSRSHRQIENVNGELASIEDHMLARSGQVLHVGRSGGDNGVEERIARDVTRKVMSQLGSAGLVKRHSGSSHIKGSMHSVEQRLAEDRRKEDKDQADAERLLHRMSSLAKSFDLPQNPADAVPQKIALPLSDDLQPSAVGPTDENNYWEGDHYHDQSGPAGVRLNTFDSGDDDAYGDDALVNVEEKEPEEEADKGAEDKPVYEAAGEEGEGEEEKDAWATRDNREKLQALGVNVMNANSPTFGWVSSDNSPASASEAARARDEITIHKLHEAGVVTDRLPLLGRDYEAAIPNPAFDHGPEDSEVSASLEEGHRYVDPREAKLAKAGVNVVAGNALLPEASSEAQREHPYLDGMGDKMADRHTAVQHKPLWFMLTNPKRKSSALEGKGVNVWGSPLKGLIPNGFFGKDFGGDDKGGEKLRSMGVRVNRYSLVPEHAPVPHDA